jgi:hypothetical protein
MLGLSAINLITTVVFCRDTGIKRGQYPVQKHICHADTHQLSLLKITLINQLKGPVNSAGKARWAGILNGHIRLQTVSFLCKFYHQYSIKNINYKT